ncbi:MAG: ATP-binding cassette domain-containing protein [Bacteroidetes bacterium]|jgi:ribose transport system ATP-binding protein|nr:ATP-binding cassette domain-containing protein [Bacteroidota bacterium]
MKPILKIRNISKSFHGIKALDDVSMDIYPGQVSVLVGENGAGKSTLMKIISGVYTQYQGHVIYKDKAIDFNSPKDAQENGISIIHQELNTIEGLTIAENVFLGREFRNKFNFIHYRKMNQATRNYLSKIGLDVAPANKVGDLKVSEQQVVEIAKALSFDAGIIIMDEPTSSLTGSEKDALFKIIADLKSRGVAIIYITHKMDEIKHIADQVIGLRDGKMVGQLPAKGLTKDQIIRMMVGRDLTDGFKRSSCIQDTEIMSVHGITQSIPGEKQRYKMQDVSFSLNKGEVLGVFGLIGAGRTELLEALFGVNTADLKGSINVNGKPAKIKHVKDAMNAGMGLVPEDRKLQGLILEMQVMENMSITSLKNLSSVGFIHKKKEKSLAAEYIHKLSIKTPSAFFTTQKLSGGNQQKVVLAKWLEINPGVLLLDEPTRGIDVGAKFEIYKLIDDLAKQGMGIMMVSSELPELLSVADRIMVMCEGAVTAMFNKQEATEEIIINAALPKK